MPSGRSTSSPRCTTPSRARSEPRSSPSVRTRGCTCRGRRTTRRTVRRSIRRRSTRRTSRPCGGCSTPASSRSSRSPLSTCTGCVPPITSRPASSARCLRRRSSTAAILGHEGVQPERVDALGLHLARLGARSTLVALMFRADDDIRKIVRGDDRRQRRSDGSAPATSSRRVWRIDDRESDRTDPGAPRSPAALHHRRASSGDGVGRALGSEPAGRRAPACPPSCSPTRSCGCWAFHRRVVGPLPMSVDELLSRLRERVTVEEVSDPARRARGLRALRRRPLVPARARAATRRPRGWSRSTSRGSTGSSWSRSSASGRPATRASSSSRTRSPSRS